MNAAWINLALSVDKSELAKTGMLWDGILTLCYLTIPVLLGARFTAQMAAGLTLVLIGIFVIKIA